MKKKKKYIEFLNNTAYNVVGEIVEIEYEEDDDLYYTDAMNGWSYIEKESEGKDFRYVTGEEYGNDCGSDGCISYYDDNDYIDDIIDF